MTTHRQKKGREPGKEFSRFAPTIKGQGYAPLSGSALLVFFVTVGISGGATDHRTGRSCDYSPTDRTHGSTGGGMGACGAGVERQQRKNSQGKEA